MSSLGSSEIDSFYILSDSTEVTELCSPSVWVKILGCWEIGSLKDDSDDVVKLGLADVAAFLHQWPRLYIRIFISDYMLLI